jgi:hypothetical protein
MLTKLVIAITILAVFAAFAGTVPGKIAGGNITVTNPVTLKGTALQPGVYHVTVTPGKVLFTQGKDSHEFPVKIETAPHKFGENQVQYEGAGKELTISQIALGGTKLRLLFN